MPAVAVVAVLGALLPAVGWLGRTGRVDFALGGWTRESASPESWRAAHVVIGTWFMRAAGLAVTTALTAMLVPVDSIGPVVVVGSAAMLGPVVMGVASGSGKLVR